MTFLSFFFFYLIYPFQVYDDLGYLNIGICLMKKRVSLGMLPLAMAVSDLDPALSHQNRHHCP